MMLPQVGAGGGGPMPMKLSAASARTPSAKTKVICTTTGARKLGRRCVSMIRRLPEPLARAASMYCCCAMTSTEARTMRAVRGV